MTEIQTPKNLFLFPPIPNYIDSVPPGHIKTLYNIFSISNARHMQEWVMRHGSLCILPVTDTDGIEIRQFILGNIF